MTNRNHSNTTTNRDTIQKTTEKLIPSMITTTYEMSDDEMKEFFNLDPVQSSRTSREDHHANEILLDDESTACRLIDLLEIPDYLLFTKNNIFEQMVQQKIYHSTSSVNIEELGHIAILMHQCHVLELEKTLYTHYFKSGTGILKVNESNLKVWPSNVKRTIQLNQRATTISDPNQIKVDDDRCLKFVNEHLRELNEKQYQIQEQLVLKKKQFFGYTMTMDEILQTFIQEHLQALRLKYECKIKLVDFDYRERLLEHAFLQQNPLEQQIELTKRLFHYKYDYEKAKEEVLWMKQQVAHNKIPRSINAIQIPLLSSIQSSVDTDLHQQLLDRHHRIIQQYQSEMTTIIMDMVQVKLRESQKIFDDEIASMWKNQRTLPTYQRLNPTMIALIDRHLLMLSEKVQCIYHYKNAILNT